MPGGSPPQRGLGPLHHLLPLQVSAMITVGVLLLPSGRLPQRTACRRLQATPSPTKPRFSHAGSPLASWAVCLQTAASSRVPQQQGDWQLVTSSWPGGRGAGEGHLADSPTGGLDLCWGPEPCRTPSVSDGTKDHPCPDARSVSLPAVIVSLSAAERVLTSNPAWRVHQGSGFRVWGLLHRQPRAGCKLQPHKQARHRALPERCTAGCASVQLCGHRARLHQLMRLISGPGRLTGASVLAWASRALSSLKPPG